MSEENKAIVRRAFEEIFNQGNLNAADELFAPNYVDHDPASPIEARGPEGIKRLVDMYRTAFPDIHFTFEDQIAEGDKVVTRFTVQATHRGDFMGIAPTGNRVTVTGIDIARIVEGKITETRGNYDTLGLMQQLGVIPRPEHSGEANST